MEDRSLIIGWRVLFCEGQIVRRDLIPGQMPIDNPMTPMEVANLISDCATALQQYHGYDRANEPSTNGSGGE